jgi:hypothetical protein
MRFELERELDDWKRPKIVCRQIEQLTREPCHIIKQRGPVKKNSYMPKEPKRYQLK